MKKLPIDEKLDEEMLHLLELMAQADRTTAQYAQMTEQLAKLHELRQKNRVSADALATIGANLTGILLILSHERAHVIASKAFTLVKKIF